MRALARADGIKLGALQYHFPTWNELLRSLAKFVLHEYTTALDGVRSTREQIDIVTLTEILLDDAPGDELLSERLLPQLWAMGRVEPVMEEALHELYSAYLTMLETSLISAGCSNPRPEALALMSVIEGTTIFLDRTSPWARDWELVKEHLLSSLREKYGFTHSQSKQKKEPRYG